MWYAPARSASSLRAYSLSARGMLLVFVLRVPDASTVGMISSSGRKLSGALSLTTIWFLGLDFHTGLLLFSARPTPICLHLFGGLMPISTKFDQILSPLLSHLRILSSCSSSLGRHLLFSMRLMASTETLKCSASTGVVNFSGCVWCRCLMPSIVSGDSFFRGFQLSPSSFLFIASFSACHAGRVARPSVHSAVVSSKVVVAIAFGDLVGASGALCDGRALGNKSDGRRGLKDLSCNCRRPKDNLTSVRERARRPKALPARNWQFMVDAVAYFVAAIPSRKLGSTFCTDSNLQMTDQSVVWSTSPQRRCGTLNGDATHLVPRL